MAKLPDKLFKTTIVIWSEYDPSANNMELEDLAREATGGDAYCSKQEGEWVDPRMDEAWDGSEFFGTDDGEEDEDGEEPAAEA